MRFFRKIRYIFISDGKAVKYLKYAVGEIVLVVIGILIALQINNWNENAKARETEIKLLIELKDDLIETKQDLLTDIEKSEQILRTTNEMYKAANEDRISASTPFKLSTGYLLETAMLFPKLSAYEAIQSKGITIISNDNLRKRITDFYQLHLERVHSAEAYLDNINNEELKPYLTTYALYGSTCEDCMDLYSLYTENQEVQPNLYLITHANEKLVHMLKEKFNVFNTLKKRYIDLSQSIDEIISFIDQETEDK